MFAFFKHVITPFTVDSGISNASDIFFRDEYDSL